VYNKATLQSDASGAVMSFSLAFYGEASINDDATPDVFMGPLKSARKLRPGDIILDDFASFQPDIQDVKNSITPFDAEVSPVATDSLHLKITGSSIFHDFGRSSIDRPSINLLHPIDLIDDWRKLEKSLIPFQRIATIPHSCSPNAVIHLSKDGTKATVRAANAIKRGEHITRSYIPDLFATVDERQKQLEGLLGWQSACSCAICSLCVSDESFQKFDNLLRSRIHSERASLQKYILLSEEGEGEDRKEPVVKSLKNLIKLLELGYGHGVCDVLGLRALHFELARILLVRPKIKNFQ
jgi:hypothetical protein